MARKNCFSSRNARFIFLLILGTFWKHCESQMNSEDSNRPPDGGAEDSGGAFFALRSCHQVLQGDSGELFSPDYLCSNPPLWCNWTLQVARGKRIQLHLEDLTPDDACSHKQDQVHIDEPVEHATGHKVLQKCWYEAKFTSWSNTLYVVLLISGWPAPPYRGFYGRYQAFGQPAAYHPQQQEEEEEGPPGRHTHTHPSIQHNRSVTASPDVYDYYDDRASVATERTAGAPTAQVDEHNHPYSDNYGHAVPFTTMATVRASANGTPRSGWGAITGPTTASPWQQQHGDEHTHATQIPTTTQDEREEMSTILQEEEVAGSQADGTQKSSGQKMEVVEDSDHSPTSQFEGPGPERHETEESYYPHPNMVEQLSDHRGDHHIRNHSVVPHLPGNHLFEVSIEVNFIEDLDESWDSVSKLLMQSVKALISERLEPLKMPLFIYAKRIKRLRAGALYILWLQLVKGPGGPRVHNSVRSAMQSLIATQLSVPGVHHKAAILSVSTGDVNECGSQLVLCDANADCTDDFGSYSCVCRPGFKDVSRLGSGGTVCVGEKDQGCPSGPSAETKVVYVLFFLLSALLLLLLLVSALLYQRHHQGAFLLRCHANQDHSISSKNRGGSSGYRRRPDDSFSTPPEVEVPPMPPFPPLPPPPPLRGFRERLEPVDLPLLRFSPLTDGGADTHTGGKM